ncbi:RNA polymerase sigma factor [Ancylomarina sp. DW003]|nr:RNA polymerase sigma factor [Ancylomarina sp. DW003]MDE5421078.1 RNA polymerase sigma factor [Ancylomarina sp. DW003]
MTRSSLTSETNKEHAAKSKNCDTISFGVLYERHFDKVYYQCLSFSKNHDEAYDLTQEIFLKIFDKLHTFEGRSHFTTWLFKLTQNHCIEYYRKNKRFTYEDIMNHEYHLIDDNDEAMLNDQININNILDNLTESDKLMLSMKYLEGNSIKEIQDKFQIGASAVKMRIQRAKRKVEKKFDFLMN